MTKYTKEEVLKAIEIFNLIDDVCNDDTYDEMSFELDINIVNICGYSIYDMDSFYYKIPIKIIMNGMKQFAEYNDLKRSLSNTERDITSCQALIRHESSKAYDLKKYTKSYILQLNADSKFKIERAKEDIVVLEQTLSNTQKAIAKLQEIDVK